MIQAKHSAPMLVAAFALLFAACSKPESHDAAQVPAKPKAKHVATAPPELPKVFAPQAPAKELRTEYPASMFNGAPPTTPQLAWDRGQEAVDHLLSERKIPTTTFYVKESNWLDDGLTMEFFGTPNNKGQFLRVKVFIDGHVEIVEPM